MSGPDGKKDNTLIASVVTIGAFLALFWALEIVDQLVFDQGLDQYGIVPRSTRGLLGIVFAPFLHGGFGHLAANSGPFVVLGLLVRWRGGGPFTVATVVIALIAGIGVWLTGAANSVHIGASGLIFGYLGFLLFVGIFERSLKGILIAILVGLAYGGIIWGVMPGQPGISWQGHLFGFVGGVAAARLVAKKVIAARAAS